METVDNGADAELLLAGRPDLADEEKIEIASKRLGNLEGDGYASARKREDNRMLIRILLQRKGEPPAGVAAILEETFRLRAP
jgi:hypothetical protein